MEIAVIGAGKMGATLARHLVHAGHRVRISNGKAPSTLQDRLHADVKDLTAATTADAVEPAAIIVLAVMWAQVPAALGAVVADVFRGKILVDACNPYVRQGNGYVLVDLFGQSSSGQVGGYAPGARVVKAFNTINAESLATRQRPPGAPDRIAVPIAGDEAEAKRVVMALVDAVGFAPLDAGTLFDSRLRQEPGRPLYNRDLTLAEAEEELRKFECKEVAA